MKVLKRIITILVIIVAMVLIIAAFLPSKVDVTREAVIKAPVEIVYKNVLDYNHYRQWNPWGRMDKDAVHKLEGNPGTIGCSWTWIGDTLGTGGMTLTQVDKHNKIVNRLVFTAPQAMESDDIWTFKQTPEGVKVIWTTANELSWPVNRLFGLLLDGMVGPQMEEGLEYLNDYSKKPKKSQLVTLRLDVKGMTCEGCENTVKNAISSLDGIHEVTASHKNEEVCVTFATGTVEMDKIAEAITGVGYDVKGEKIKSEKTKGEKVKKGQKKKSAEQ